MIAQKHIYRFFSKVKKTESCWIYQGAIWKTNGYGSFSIGRKTYRAHRFSYEIHNGSFDKKLCILHKCDNPKCVNPDHLFKGTQLDNMQDRLKKGRSKIPYGSSHWRTKFTEKDIQDIKNKREKGVYMTQIAKEYGVHYNTIRYIFSGRNWSHA